MLFDENKFTELDANMESADPLKFKDTKPYPKRIKETQEKSQLKDAVRTAYGKMNGLDITIACMDFSFIGGSMGSVVGEKIARAMDHSLKHKIPFLNDLPVRRSAHDGGRTFIDANGKNMPPRSRSWIKQKFLIYPCLTDPTTGGVTASYAMLGDFNIAEPGAFIGFAGPRVIRETIGKDLPKGFQSAEFVLEHGFPRFYCRPEKSKEQAIYTAANASELRRAEKNH